MEKDKEAQLKELAFESYKTSVKLISELMVLGRHPRPAWEKFEVNGRTISIAEFLQILDAYTNSILKGE